MTEREIKLSVPPGFKLPDLDGLVEGSNVVVEQPRRLRAVYFDTPDLRLARWGASLRHRSDSGWTVKLPGTVTDGLLARDEHVFPGSPGKVPAEALDLLAAYRRTATLGPVARLVTLRRPVAVRTAGDEPLLEVVDDEVSVLEGRRVAMRFREIEVELAPNVDGGALLLRAIVDRLHSAGAGKADPTPKIVRALGPGVQQKPEIEVADVVATQPLEASLRQAVAASVIRILRHDAIVRIGDDPEGVHQARVGIRKLRSDLRTFRSIVDREWSDAFVARLRPLAHLLGAVRDRDVMLERFAKAAGSLRDARGVDGVLARLTAARDRDRDALLRAMREPGYLELLDALVEVATGPLKLLPDAVHPAAEALPQLLLGPWHRLTSAVKAADDPPQDDQLHQIRIGSKRLRYAAEAAAPVLGKKASKLAKAAEDLQEVLGDHQDAVVAYAWLREVAGTSRGSQAFAAGQLAGMEALRMNERRAEWGATWKRVRKAWPKSWT